jgi:hypothetical protein
LAGDERRLIKISGGLSPATDAWQVGATGPPATCLCCGKTFTSRTREMMGPYLNGPYRYVCRLCWELPFVFFPDKVIASCGECWLPKGQSRHRHFKARDRMHPRPSGKPATARQGGRAFQPLVPTRRSPTHRGENDGA